MLTFHYHDYNVWFVVGNTFIIIIIIINDDYHQQALASSSANASQLH